MSAPSVYITRSAAFLPNDPVDNDAMESVLGQIGARPSRARRIVLRNNGIRRRFYALDPASGEPTHSNAELTAAAIRGLTGNGFAPEDIQCIATGTSTPDQLMPNHGVMVHGEIGNPACEVVSTAGICLSGVTALKYAYLSVLAHNTRNAVAAGSEISSALLHARNFRLEDERRVAAMAAHPEIAFDKDFLRWMLSDGAGAFLLQDSPRPDGLSLRLEWLETASYAHRLPACMICGAERHPDGGTVGWMRWPSTDLARDSIFAVKQDVRLLNENVVRHTLELPLTRVTAKRGLEANDVDWFLPHMSSEYFRQPIADCLERIGLPIPRERWFTNLSYMGNTGAASIFIMVDELFRSGRLRAGERLLCFIPESGRFSSGFIYLTVV